MEKFLNKLERDYGKYAIHNLSLVLIVCYVIGYVLQIIAPGIAEYLVLNPYLVLHGQIWRLVTWILIPPESLSIWTIVMLSFYYFLGTQLEYAWGTFRYNVYLFSGMLFTIIGSFVLYGIAWMEFGDLITANNDLTAQMIFTQYAQVMLDGEWRVLPAVWFAGISTYFINLSIILAFAATFPNERVMLMFVIPLKIKYLGILYAVMLGYQFMMGTMADKVIILASLLNFFIFFFMTRSFRRISPAEYKRKARFKREVERGRQAGNTVNYQGRNVITRHKCAICGRTELDDETLEFRFCSKCDGNYEYCMDHLYTHEHVRRIVPAAEKKENE